jgi:RRM-like domain
LQEVIYTICHPHGSVLRIVIFKKNGVQAMVEFDSIDSATRARDNLNGCDIYSACCTLKIDYAKVRRHETMMRSSCQREEKLRRFLTPDRLRIDKFSSAGP